MRYTNLSPRHYRFRMMAANNSGVWNEQGDSIDFVIPPAWYQTIWFRALCVVAFCLLLWAAYHLRVHQLREQEKKFREAVETMPALAFITLPNGDRSFVNKRWVEYTGMSREGALGTGWHAAVHPDDLNRVKDRWRVSLASGQPLEYEVRLRRGSDGAYRWFLARAVPVRDKRGRIEKWCGAATDIEDGKRAEQLQTELAHVSRVNTMGEMVASIAHDLLQPIAAATLNAETSVQWLRHDPPDLEKVLKGVTNSIEANTLASEIIDHLRTLYKKTPPRRELVVVNEVIGEMVVLLRGEAYRHAVSIRTDLAADLPGVNADRVQVQQVLMNLLLNGIEAMKETGGVITVKSELGEDGKVLISVSDTGEGLPDGKAERIFDAFFTTKPQGSGMGLAISRSIVESHGGRIWANGNGGRGATFHFTLPAAKAEVNTSTTAT